MVFAPQLLRIPEIQVQHVLKALGPVQLSQAGKGSCGLVVRSLSGGARGLCGFIGVNALLFPSSTLGVKDVFSLGAKNRQVNRLNQVDPGTIIAVCFRWPRGWPLSSRQK